MALEISIIGVDIIIDKTHVGSVVTQYQFIDGIGGANLSDVLTLTLSINFEKDSDNEIATKIVKSLKDEKAKYKEARDILASHSESEIKAKVIQKLL